MASAVHVASPLPAVDIGDMRHSHASARHGPGPGPPRAPPSVRHVTSMGPQLTGSQAHKFTKPTRTNLQNAVRREGNVQVLAEAEA
ncbi:unnamed protein product [Cutaneotrichosporon oleaginosum]